LIFLGVLVNYYIMPNTSETLKQLVETFAVEAEKFYGGNNAAGARARKALQEIGKYAKSERKAIQEEKNSRKAGKAA
jgi:hypothetical protein